MRIKLKRKPIRAPAIPVAKKKLKIRLAGSVASIPVRIADAAQITAQRAAQDAAQFLKELIWAQTIRQLHHSELPRTIGAMGDERYHLYMKRLEQLIAIEEAGTHRCLCGKCGGKCPVKIRGSSSTVVCYDCTFGKHRGKSLPSVKTSQTEARHERKKVRIRRSPKS